MLEVVISRFLYLLKEEDRDEEEVIKWCIREKLQTLVVCIQ